MRFILLAIGTGLSVLFIIKLSQGKNYESYVVNLDDNDFPLKCVYGAGFAWSAGKLFQLKGNIASDLKNQASLLYDSQYAEYYATIAWAQMLSLVHLFLSFTFLVAGFIYDMAVLFIVVGCFLSIVIAAYCLQNMKNKLTLRTEKCETQLPEVVSTMAILVNSGMTLREAWVLVGESGEGDFYMLMRRASENMKNGYSDVDAIFLFGKESNSTEIKKFTSALIQSLEKGGAELSTFLMNQSSELWNTKRQRMLQKGERAATKLLLPIVLIFLGIIIIVMTAAFAGSLF